MSAFKTGLMLAMLCLGLLPAAVLAAGEEPDAVAYQPGAGNASTAVSTWDKVHRSWGVASNQAIIEASTRLWMAKGRSEFEIFHHPATGRTEEKCRFDEQESKLLIMEISMRVPRVRWLRITGELGVSNFEVDNEHGDFTDNEVSTIGGGVLNRYTGVAKLRDLNRYQINLGVIILGQDAFWSDNPSRSSLMFYAGYRQHDENFRITHAQQTITNGVQTSTTLRSNSYYFFNYEMPQVGLRAHFGFDDMFKGFSGLLDFSYMFGRYTGHGYWADTDTTIEDRSQGYGPALRLGLEYKRKWFSATIGYEWTWLQCKDGYREGVPGDDDFQYANTKRYGLYLGLGLRF